MTIWHPPIPAGIATSAAIHNLQYKTAVLLLVYCYDSVRRDGRATINLKEAAAELQEPYGTVRRWWQELRNGPFFCEQIDRGKLGWDVKFAEDWIDWHVLSNNFQRSPMNVDNPSIDLSMTFERSPVNVDTSAYKVLNTTDQAKESAVRKKRAPRTPKDPIPDVVVTALADVCKIDRGIATKTQRDQLYQSAGILARAGAKQDQAPEQIADAIAYVAGYYQKYHWRGKKGEPPTPALIREVWREAIDARKNNGHAAGYPVPPTVAAARQPQQPSAPSESRRGILAERQKAHEGK